jgi:hypothetical protein
MAMEPQQGSPMSKMDGTRLPSAPWPFWTCISTSGKVKIMMKNVASKSIPIWPSNKVTSLYATKTNDS